MTSARARSPDQLPGKWEMGGRQRWAGGSPGHTHLGMNPSSATLTLGSLFHLSEPHTSAAKENDAIEGVPGG